jgi:hypothetical protein
MSKEGKPVHRAEVGGSSEESSADIEINPGLTPAIGFRLKTLGYGLPSFLFLTLLSLGSVDH